MKIEDDVWVTVRYRLFDSLGEALEPTQRELTYLQGGYGAVFPGIEAALAGHDVGYATRVHLEPEDSFGDYDAELVRLASRSQFPDNLEIGMTFEGVPGEDDEDLLYIVTDMTDEAVVLDANHPLAGMSLRFDIEVVDVRAASEDEIERERALAEDPGELDGRESPLRRIVAADEDDDLEELGGLEDDDLDDDGDADEDANGEGGTDRGDDSGTTRRRLH